MHLDKRQLTGLTMLPPYDETGERFESSEWREESKTKQTRCRRVAASLHRKINFSRSFNGRGDV